MNLGAWVQQKGQSLMLITYYQKRIMRVSWRIWKRNWKINRQEWNRSSQPSVSDVLEFSSASKERLCNTDVLLWYLNNVCFIIAWKQTGRNTLKRWRLLWDVGLMEVESFTVSLFNNRMLIITFCCRYQKRSCLPKRNYHFQFLIKVTLID